MNERIKELIEHAGMTLKPRRLYDDNEPDGYLESDLDFLDNNLEATRVFFEGGLEKFAQLIAEDCAKMLDEDSYIMPELGGYAHDIRTRYGVK
jgi:hypothetical protein